MEQLKSHAKLTATLQIFIKLTLGVTFLAILAGGYDYYTYSTLPASVNPEETLLPSDIISGLVAVVQLIVTLTTAILALRWVYHSNKNLRALSGESLEYTPGWAVGWFLIPIANLWKPYYVMKEIWEVSHQREPGDPSRLKQWWTFWILSNVVGRIALKRMVGAEDASGYATSALAFICSDGLDLVMNLLFLAVITQIGRAYAQHIAPRQPNEV